MTPANLAALHAASFTVPRPWTEAEFAALLQERGVRLHLVPGGFLLGRVVAGEAEILTLAVEPGQRRKGLGRRLVAAFIADAAHMGAETAVLEVAEGNEAAIGLYRAAGFAVTGRRRGYFLHPGGSREDAITMAARLKPVA